MNEVTKQKIANNWHIVKKSASTYVVAAVTAGGAWWLGKDAGEQVAWLNAHAPLAALVPYVAYITGALWLLSRLWPQFFPPPAVVKDAAALKYDAWVKQAQEMGFMIPGGPAPAPAPATVSVTVQPPAPPPAAVRQWTEAEKVLWDALKAARAARNAPPIDSPLP